MNKCTNDKLRLFSNKHFTYINQIFGDETVREIITEMYAERDLKFAIEETGAEFEYSNHHILVKPGKAGESEKWCSVDEGYQNIFINKNDTLCQSYTLLKYLRKPISADMKKRQMEMIKMYRNIIRREHFKTEFKKVVTIMQEKIGKSKKKNDVSIWRDYTHTPDTYLNKDYDKIYEEIGDVLDTWESYGYLYFIKEGVCGEKRK